MSVNVTAYDNIIENSQDIYELRKELAQTIKDNQRPIPACPKCILPSMLWYKVTIVLLLFILYYYHINCLWRCDCPKCPAPLLLPKRVPSFSQHEKPRGCQTMLQKPFKHGDSPILHSFCSGGLGLAHKMA